MINVEAASDSSEKDSEGGENGVSKPKDVVTENMNGSIIKDNQPSE